MQKKQELMNFTTNNKKLIEDTEVFKIFREEFDSNIQFLEKFSLLILSNRRIISFYSKGKPHIINTTLLDNSIQTLKSIKLCCKIGSFADANTLIRKLRDDLILYVYILDVANKNNPFLPESANELKTDNSEEFCKSFLELKLKTQLTEDEKVVEAWLTNTVLELPRNIKLKLSFENYMKFLKKNDTIIKILDEYKLEKYWEDLRHKLNNYVHNNGIQFASHNLIKEHSEYLEVYLKNINIRTSYIITIFIVLIIMTEGAIISSTDMIDYLDCDMEPPEDCQYEIAPFIQDYIDQKVVPIHPELKDYLKDNNNYGMKIK
jgi:hypothetical protein